MLTNDRLKKIARTRKTRLRSDTNVLSLPFLFLLLSLLYKSVRCAFMRVSFGERDWNNYDSRHLPKRWIYLARFNLVRYNRLPSHVRKSNDLFPLVALTLNTVVCGFIRVSSTVLHWYNSKELCTQYDCVMHVDKSVYLVHIYVGVVIKPNRTVWTIFRVVKKTVTSLKVVAYRSIRC